MNLRAVVFLYLVFSTVCAFAYDVPHSVVEKFGDRNLTPVEGAWLWNNGALVTIESDSQGGLTLILVDSPDPLQETPRVIGTGIYAGNPGTYKFELKADSSVAKKSALRTKVSFIASVSDNRMSLKPYSTGLRVNAWRLIPYLFRLTITHDKDQASTEGAIRVWPPLGSPEFPVIL